MRKGFPLNIMYWAVRKDGNYEIIDGQQRTVSICQYMENEFSLEIKGHPTYFHNSTADKQQVIRDYELMVYLCEGTDSEKLDWFRTINITSTRGIRAERPRRGIVRCCAERVIGGSRGCR